MNFKFLVTELECKMETLLTSVFSANSCVNKNYWNKSYKSCNIFVLLII